jgi:hypothetical protein
MKTDADTWGPSFWFFLHTLGHNYPKTPNEVTKRKYYDLIMNMPLFIPDANIGKKFNTLLDKFPVTPYLGSSENFQKWLHFIHNHINKNLGKIQISRKQANDIYVSKYADKSVIAQSMLHIKKQYIYMFYILVGILIMYMINL